MTRLNALSDYAGVMVKAFDTIATLRIAGFTLVSVCVCACVWSTPLAAQVTPAGGVIESAAQATYDEAGTTRAVSSNRVEVRVAELLSLALASREAGASTTRPGRWRCVS